MKKYKWGIIGAGLIAHKMAEALKLNSRCTLYAVASKDPKKAQKFASQHQVNKSLTYQEIANCEEIDIIYIATTHNFHFENAKLALEHGKNVLVEKSFTVNALQAQELVRLARNKNLFLMEAMWVRFLPSYQRLKKEIKNQTIGKIKLAQLAFGRIISETYRPRLEKIDLAGGALLDLGVYPISFLSYILEEIPTEIKSMAQLTSQQVDEHAHYLFRYPSGALASVMTSFNVNTEILAILYGEQGYLKFPQFQEGEKFTIYRHNGTNTVTEVIEIEEKNHHNGFIYQVEEVIQCLDTQQTESTIIPLSETISLMKVMDQMRAEWNMIYPFE